MNTGSYLLTYLLTYLHSNQPASLLSGEFGRSRVQSASRQRRNRQSGDDLTDEKKHRENNLMAAAGNDRERESRERERDGAGWIKGWRDTERSSYK